MTTVRILTAALMCSALALSACQKKAETPPADTAAPADAATAPAAPTADAAATPAATNVPAECQSYLDHVKACTDKLSKSNAMVAEQMQRSVDQTRAQWSAISDQAALANACKTADDSFKSTSTAMGC
ncbi:MAG: hypothetical protein K1X35_12405 [Caulobacteraceae bacterium]|nr:hypothetical protein [Caulobacteraceae bacterium]